MVVGKGLWVAVGGAGALGNRSKRELVGHVGVRARPRRQLEDCMGEGAVGV